MAKRGYVYILGSDRNGTLYIGVTSDLSKPIRQHKEKTAEGFTRKYGVDRLVYVETLGGMSDAIRREKQLKKWNRKWKLRLIEETNPEWKDLFEEFYG